MRLRKRTLSRRVNGDLTIQFGDEQMTSHAGLEFVAQQLRDIWFNERLRHAFRDIPLRSDYPFVAVVRLFLAMLWVGGRRLRHVRFLAHDPLVRRFVGLNCLPDERTLSRWLKQFNGSMQQGWIRLNWDLVIRRVRSLRLRRLTIDVDGSVVSTGQSVAWAFRGHNPHHRKVPSYYPIFAHLAQTGQILLCKNRPGNIHDGRRALEFLRDVIHGLRRPLGRTIRLEFRMDAAFFQRPVLALLIRSGCEFAIKVPMWHWLGLRKKIQMRMHWKPVAPGVSAFVTSLSIPQWDQNLRVVCFRKKVFHLTDKNFQLDLFSPDDGIYEYSAVATNKNLTPRRLWLFMCGRGAQEKTLAELKGGFAFDTVPTNHYGANSAWQWISVLAHNLFRDFQLGIAEEAVRRTPKCTFLHRLTSIATARFEWVNVAGRMLNLASRLTLRLPASTEIQRIHDRWQPTSTER